MQRRTKAPLRLGARSGALCPRTKLDVVQTPQCPAQWFLHWSTWRLPPFWRPVPQGSTGKERGNRKPVQTSARTREQRPSTTSGVSTRATLKSSIQTGAHVPPGTGTSLNRALETTHRHWYGFRFSRVSGSSSYRQTRSQGLSSRAGRGKTLGTRLSYREATAYKYRKIPIISSPKNKPSRKSAPQIPGINLLPIISPPENKPMDC